MKLGLNKPQCKSCAEKSIPSDHSCLMLQASKGDHNMHMRCTSLFSEDLLDQSSMFVWERDLLIVRFQHTGAHISE